MAKYACLEEDYKFITQSLNPLVPPIFISDENARCSEWNASMERLTGWERSEVVGKMIPKEIFGRLCRMENLDDVTELMILLYQTLCSQENDNITFAFFNREGTYVETILTSNKRIDMSGKTVGCFCFLQTVLPCMQQTLDEVDCFSRLKNLEYICQEIKTPLHGLQFTRKLLENARVSNDEKQLLETSDACERQMMAIIEATSTEKPENGMIHTGEGIPVQFIKDMFEEDTRCISEEGFGLCISHKLLKKMNGHIQYVREPSNCYFLINVTFPKTASERGNTSEVKNELN